MRGPINASVKLKVVRGPKKDIKDFTVVRELIHVQSVRSHVQDGDIGYVRITQFTEHLDFLNESDKDWVMGRGIMQRLKWT